MTDKSPYAFLSIFSFHLVLIAAAIISYENSTEKLFYMPYFLPYLLRFLDRRN